MKKELVMKCIKISDSLDMEERDIFKCLCHRISDDEKCHGHLWVTYPDICDSRRWDPKTNYKEFAGKFGLTTKEMKELEYCITTRSQIEAFRNIAIDWDVDSYELDFDVHEVMLWASQFLPDRMTYEQKKYYDTIWRMENAKQQQLS